MLLFLGNLRSTLIAAIAIPTSIIATFGLIWYMGFTLNTHDDAGADALGRHRHRRRDRRAREHLPVHRGEAAWTSSTAAVEATREIGLAVLATTLSLVAIFVPVGFMGGIVGRFMKSFGLTMAFAIMVSLLVSFTLTPMLSARWLKVRPHGKDKHSSKDSRIFHAIDVFYTRLLEWSMAHRAIVAGVAVLVLLSSVPLFMIAEQELPAATTTSPSSRSTCARPKGTSLESTEVITNRIATAVRRAAPGGRLHAGDDRRRPGAHAQPGDHLRPADADRAARRAISSRS